MNFYHIKENYINYLRGFDAKVAINKNESRPYIGILLTIDSKKYFAPFTSPKSKHLKMKNTLDFRKIDNGKLGAINLNNMIPVVDEAIITFDISKISDLKYKTLLQNQYNSIKKDWANIVKNSQELYDLLTKPIDKKTKYELIISKRCCDIMLLEKVIINYKSNK